MPDELPPDTPVNSEPTLIPESQPTPESTPEPVATETPSLTPEAPAQPPQPEQPTLSYAQAARALGFQISENASDDEVRRDLRALVEHARYGYQARQQPQQPPPAQPVTPASPQAEQEESDPLLKAWGVKPIEQSYLAQVEVDPDTGLYKAKYEWTPPNVVQAVNEYASNLVERQKEFLRNPYKATYEALKPALLDEIKQVIASEYEQRQAEQQVRQQEQQLTERVFARSSDGNYLVSAATGEYVRTPFGDAYLQARSRLQAAGVNSELELVRLATEFAERSAGPAPAPGQPQQPALTPEQVSQQKQQAFLAGATAGPNRSTNFASVDTPDVYRSGELNSFFANAARAAGIVN